MGKRRRIPSDEDPPTRERRKMINRIRDGLQQPPVTVDLVTPQHLSGEWVCDSTTSFGTTHKIYLGICHGRITFQCTCHRESGGELTIRCKHITAVLLQMCLDQADNYAMAEERKEELSTFFSDFDRMTL